MYNIFIYIHIHKYIYIYAYIYVYIYIFIYLIGIEDTQYHNNKMITARAAPSLHPH
jgi:hypothetical protein